MLHGCTTQLNYTPSPVAVFAPDPHYTSAGLNSSENNGKHLSADAHIAYQAALCFLLIGDVRFAANTQHILDAWAGTLTKISTPQGRDNVNFDLHGRLSFARSVWRCRASAVTTWRRTVRSGR